MYKLILVIGLCAWSRHICADIRCYICDSFNETFYGPQQEQTIEQSPCMYRNSDLKIVQCDSYCVLYMLAIDNRKKATKRFRRRLVRGCSPIKEYLVHKTEILRMMNLSQHPYNDKDTKYTVEFQKECNSILCNGDFLIIKSNSATTNYQILLSRLILYCVLIIVLL
ncbi:hypothetical protein GJ496_000906 [Pomphorhynchus laevis]|nr:hypothetical protein GJ496_000906 [Pomphorhynchus laevis]